MTLLLAQSFVVVAQQSPDPVAAIGQRLQAILRPLEELEPDTARSRAKLETALAALKQLQTDLAPLYREPRHRDVAQRIALHLQHLIKWNQFLLRRRGIDPEASPRRLARSRGLQLLREAKQYELDHPADRYAIAQRWTAALESLRGSPEEREIVARLNALWDEVSDGVAVATPPPVAEKPDPTEKPPVATPATGEPVPTAPLDAEALKELRSAAVNGTVAERVRAARTLGGQRASWLGGFLAGRLLKEPDESVRAALDGAVRQVADRHVARALTRWSRLKEAPRRIQAISILGVIDHDEAGKTLRAFAKEKDLAVQRALLVVGQRMPKGRGIPAIARLIESRSAIRPEGIVALGESGFEEAAPVLVSFLHRRKFEEEKPLVMRAFKRLGPVAVPALIRALEATDYRQHASVALRRVTGQRFGLSANRWKQWWRQNAKRLRGEQKQ